MTDRGDAVLGGVVYRWSPWRFAFAVAVIGFAAAAVVWLAISLLSSALAGDLELPSVPDAVLFVGVYTFSFAAFSVLITRGKPSWLKLGDEGIELAAARRDAVWIPYMAVSSARMRWIWPLSVLDVFVGVGEESRVARLDRGGRRPLRTRRGERLRFSMPLAGLGASAATVRSELRNRGLTE